MAAQIKKKKREEAKTTSETMILAAINSPYRVCTPMWNAEHIRITDPVTRVDRNFSVTSESFVSYFLELSKLGLKDKLLSEIDYFRTSIDPAWSKTYDMLTERLSATEEQQ